MNMDKILGWFTKKRLFFIGFVGIVLFVVSLQHDLFYKLYISDNNFLINTFLYFRIFFIFLSSLFVISIFSFFVGDKTFYSWKKTIPIYLFIYLLVVIITPWKDGDAYFRIAKDLFALYVSVGYLVCSLIFIAYKSSKK